MYKREFDNLIKSGELPSSILLYGDNFSTAEYASFLTKKFANGSEVAKYYYDEYEFDSAKRYISQASLFGDINVLHIKSDKKVPKKELDTLVEICNKSQNSYFVYEFTGDDRVGKELARSFTKKRGGADVRFFKPSFGDAIALLSKRAQKIGLDIDTHALRELYLVHNEDLPLAVNELEKLALLDKKIDSKDIQTHVFGMGKVDIEQFISKLLAKEDIKEELNQILEHGSLDEIRIINQIQSYITTLSWFRIYITAHGTYNSVDIVGFKLPPKILEARVTQSTKISLNSYEEILKLLLDAEYHLKYEPNIDKSSYLFGFLIKLQSLL